MNGTARISGTTRLYVVLGCPVTQVRSPALMNPLFARLGVDAVLVPVHARPEHLERIVDGLRCVGNVDGIFVTVPHKAAVVAFADRCSPMVQIAGSANALRREADGSWYAETFDGLGFVAGLVNAGHDPRGRRVVLVGAGGAGSAIAAALLAAGVDGLSVCDPDAGRLAGLRSRLDAHWPGRTVTSAGPELDVADIVVNATPLGLDPGDPLPFRPDLLRPGGVVADIIMNPRETRLLREAAALGHHVHYGIHMLDGQLDSYRAFFRLDDAATTTRPRDVSRQT
ncbi:shikimate dehydrogenase family protein [Micromonospora halophytica]|uniref:Shikimate dehydrogenase n=1 Tax=Micromonospora halophytica TaxID=47864 RepID=A0A1C5HK21_9ACTN|nr:shikimate dehydrogenase [Micromonospora halophytica]SCG46335.1 shikimate dehydrogenase [Micromonospora halophytica]